MPLRIALWFALLFAPAAASAQVFVYPVPWPKAGGAMMVAVPLQSALVKVYHRTAAPHATGFDSPFPFGTPQSFNAVAGEPIFLYAPDLSTSPSADQDDFFLLVSTQRLVLSIADDERHQPGSPDRIYFMPAETGSFRGRTFYAGASGGDPSERLRIFNLSSNPSTATVSAWVNNAWVVQGTVSVPANGDAEFDPSVPQTAYRVQTTEDAFVLVGYLVDNATAPAPDVNSGHEVGSQLMGFGTAWHLRAVDALSYVVETRAPQQSGWTQVAQGTLAADGAASGTLTSGDSWIRITMTGGVGWAITGTPSLLQQTEWNGYYLPAQAQQSCLVGQKFFTNSSARTISVIPNSGTQVNIYDEASGTLLSSYATKGAWEFHNFFHTATQRVEFQNGPGAVLLVGTLNWGGCTEATDPGNCGILEGGYSMPGLAAFRCSGDLTQFSNCVITPASGCYSQPVSPDAGTEADAGEPEDAGAVIADAGTGAKDAGTTPDAGAPAVDAGSVTADAGSPDAGAGAGNAAGNGNTTEAVTGCGCASGGGSAALFAAGLMALLFVARARRPRQCGEASQRV